MNASAGMSGGAGTSGVPPGSGENPFAAYGCADAMDAASCDQAICSLEAGYQSIQMSCEGNPGMELCEAIAMCLREFTDCFTPLCPSGSAASGAAFDCMETYASCLTSVTGSTMQD